MLSAMPETVIATAPALVIYIFGMGFFNVFLVGKGIDYISRPIVTSLYFGVMSLAAVAIYYRDIFNHLATPAYATLAVSFLFLVVLILFPKLLKGSDGLSVISKNNRNVFFLRMSYSYILSKSVEILFQQVVVFTLVIKLAGIYPDPFAVIGIFAILFTAVHLPITAFIGFKFGMIFTVAAALSALVFPPLILGFGGGFVYSYIIHWLFYLLLTLLVAKSKFVRTKLSGRELSGT